MLKQVEPIDVLDHPEGLEVMGSTKENDVFKGTVIKVVQYDHGLPKFVKVEGTIYNGKSNVPFSQTVTPSMLKIFDEDVFDIAIELMKKYVALIESAEHTKLKCEKLLL